MQGAAPGEKGLPEEAVHVQRPAVTIQNLVERQSGCGSGLEGRFMGEQTREDEAGARSGG